MKIVDQDGVRFLVSDLFSDESLIHGVSTRVGGVSKKSYKSLNLWYESGDSRKNVTANRERFAAALEIAPALPITASQVHGDRILEVRKSYPDPLLIADGLVTNYPGVFIAVGGADCVPILLWDPGQRAVGAVHTGWKGTRSGIARRAIERLTSRYGSRPDQILALIGPSIGPCCYEVQEDVARYFDSKFLVHPTKGKTHLDLWKSNRRQLLDAGLKKANIEVAELCTMCHPDLFFSYRRDGAKTGGMLSVIGLRA